MLIGLTGKAGSGKTTVANYLSAYYGLYEISFASPLHNLIFNLVGYENADILNPEFKNTPNDLLFGKSPRELMQSLGTGWGRDTIHPDLWLNRVKRRVANLGSRFNYIIPDVRFQNEADWVREQGVLIHIQRDDVEPLDHPSEAGIKVEDKDICILNNSSKDVLYQTLDSILPL